MKGPRSRPAPLLLPADPLLAWARVGLQAMEMLTASARVIHHRTHRRNTPAQLFEMGHEKFLAAIESAHAVARHGLRPLPQDCHAATQHWAALAAAVVAPFHRRALRNARRMRRR